MHISRFNFMKNSVILIFLSLFTSGLVNGQTADIPPEELAGYKQQSEDLVAFLEFTMNTLGMADATAEEKDIIINQSYIKLFRDDKVQIEDDLDENRDVVSNKDVQAYLKDIDFFFNEVKFEFNIESIEHFINDNGQLYFKVTTNRNLQGITIDSDTVNANKVRYIEINLDRVNKDLKIASIYTTRLSLEEELTTWWAGLDYDWQMTFKRAITVIDDTLSFSQIKRIVEKNELDLSKNEFVTDLSPISKLTNLKKLNISNTKINDLGPLSSLTKLEVLNCSHTMVNNLEPLKYSINIREIHCNNTLITDITPLRNFAKLEKLYCFTSPINNLVPISALPNLKDLRIYDTPISDLYAVANLQSLEILNCSYSQISDLSPINGLQNLKRLDIENTKITDLSPLSNIKSLNTLFCDNTQINTLNPLKGLPNLERVYCDHTLITREEANRFMAAKPATLVIYESERLKNWWLTMSPEWQEIFSLFVEISPDPSKEQLQTIANLSELDISGNASVTYITPLAELINLKKLNCSNTQVSDLSPLKDLLDLRELNVAQTKIVGTGLDPIKNLSNLKKLDITGTAVTTLPFGNLNSLEELKCDNSQIASLGPISSLKNLKLIYADKTSVSKKEAQEFAKSHPGVVVIYQTEALESWWRGLENEWKKIFKEQVTVSDKPTREQLHKVVGLSKLIIPSNSRIINLNPVKDLFALKELQFTNTSISDLSPISELKSLEILQCSKNPIYELDPISGLVNLKYLNFENTPVKKLDPLEGLISLEEVKCSATQIKNLKPLEDLPSLKRLECYNTKLSSGKVEKLKKNKPGLEVIYY